MSSLNDLHPADVVYVIVKNCPSYFKQKKKSILFLLLCQITWISLNTFIFKTGANTVFDTIVIFWSDPYYFILYWSTRNTFIFKM